VNVVVSVVEGAVFAVDITIAIEEMVSEVVAIEVCFDVSAIDGVSVDKGVVERGCGH
jgi:hypothetical protein